MPTESPLEAGDIVGDVTERCFDIGTTVSRLWDTAETWKENVDRQSGVLLH